MTFKKTLKRKEVKNKDKTHKSLFLASVYPIFEMRQSHSWDRRFLGCPLNWIDKSPGAGMMKATYKECARDKLDDRTATCVW